MKRILFGILLFTMGAGLSALEIGSDASQAAPGRTLSGKVSFRTLGELKGKKTAVLYFWTLNCPPCVEGLGVLDTLKKEFAGKDAEFVAVLCDDVSRPAAAKKASETTANLDVPVCLDPAGELATLFLRRQDRVPMLVVVDRDGRFVWRGKVFNGKLALSDILSGKFDVDSAVKRDRFEQELADALGKKDFAAAVVILDRYSREFPADLGPVLLQARLLAIELKKEKQALRILDERLKKVPQSYSLYELKINILMLDREKNSDALDRTYREMSSTLKDNELLLYLARQLLMRPNAEWTLPHAHIILSGLLKRSDLSAPQRIRALQAMGNICYRAGRLDKAVAALEEAVELNKDAKQGASLKADLNVYRKSLEFSGKL